MSFEFKSQGFNSGSGFEMANKFGVDSPNDDDPLADVEYKDDLAEDCGAEFQALQEGFKKRAKAESDRFRKATDSEFWFAVCFRSREEKESALAALGVKPKLMGDKYIDGAVLMRMLGVDFELDSLRGGD